jgi:hypothetical protein
LKIVIIMYAEILEQLQLVWINPKSQSYTLKLPLLNFSFFPFWGGVELNWLLLRPPFGLLYHPWMMMDDDECGAIGRMLGRGNWSTQRKPTPVPFCPPQIPHDMTQAQTQTSTMESRPLTARAMARLVFIRLPEYQNFSAYLGMCCNGQRKLK